MAVLGVGLSLAPVPDEFRPLPRLRDQPRETVIATLWPKALTPAPTPGASAQPAPQLATVTPPPEPSLTDVPDDVATAPAVDDVELALSLLPEQEQKEARKLDALARAVGAQHVDIEQGCRIEGANGCEEEALGPFFNALAEMKAGTRDTPVHVVHLGDSLIASDYITGKARKRLQARHGSGGGGFFFVDRPTPNAGLATRTGRATEGWEIERLTDRSRTAVLGLTGVAFAAGDETLSTSFDASDARLADVLYLRQPGGGVIDVRVDGKLLAQLSTREKGRAADMLRVPLPENARTLTVSTRGRVALYGVAMEEAHAGVVYDSIGLPGATADTFLRANEAAFASQLEARDPALVVLMLGGNEAFELAQKRLTPEKATENFRALIERIRTGAPAAACLLVSPMAAGIRTVSGAISPRPGTKDIAEAIRTAALESGCGYWDMFTAFGGDEAFQKWLDRGLMSDDLFHPRALGGDLLGHLLDLALTRAQLAQESSPQTPVPVTRGQRLQVDRLARIFSKLAQLSKGERGRVGMVQLGASHTSAHFFTDEVRRRLAARFGDAGRGFVAAGKPSRRLEPSGVRRSLFGAWAIRDAREGGDDTIWALTGVRAEGPPQSRLEFTFCARCTDLSLKSRLQLYYVEEPGMGVMDVRLDGKTVARVPETPGAPDASAAPRMARVLALEADGAMHRLEVLNQGPGQVKVLGAAGELERPGVVYDALGLPGSTVFTIAGYDRDALTTQLQARGADLFVLWYGTNESALHDLDPEAMKQAYAKLFVALKSAAPDADCLLIAPTDRMSRQDDRTWAPSPSQDAVLNALDDVAREHGCALWSARKAMGGPGSMQTWREHQPRLAHPDHVHLTPRGYTELADAFVDDFLSAYDGTSDTADAGEGR
ncbi:MAG: GDSL-type esterase/lipase family protein [Myxococcota bacterium]